MSVDSELGARIVENPPRVMLAADVRKRWQVRSSAILLFVVLVALAWAPVGPEAGDCGAVPCPGTLPAIWPDRSAPLGDTITIYGWNFAPATAYVIAVIDPDLGIYSDVVTTDAEGTLLDTPYTYIVGDQPTGVYVVRLYGAAWGGDTTEAPIAATTFFHNNFGRH